jgi:hypothetical protein
MQRSDCSMPDQARLLSLRSFRHGAGASSSPKVPGYPFRTCRVLGSREGRCAEARALRMAHRCSLRQSQMPRPLRWRISGLTARPIRSLSTLRDHGHPWTITQDSLPVWRPPPFTVGTFTRGLRFKVSGATSFLFDQAFLARCDLRVWLTRQVHTQLTPLRLCPQPRCSQLGSSSFIFVFVHIPNPEILNVTVNTCGR